MVEDSYAFDGMGMDTRNLRGGRTEAKKRTNYKEEGLRAKQAAKREKQRNGEVEGSQAVREEFEEVNARYQRQVEEKKRLEEATQKLQQKKEMFEKDLIDLAVGPEPKQERKKLQYQEKLSAIPSINKKQKSVCSPNQRSNLLAFLQSSLK